MSIRNFIGGFMNKISTQATLKSWDEKIEFSLDLDEGIRLATVACGFSYKGDMTGESEIRFLLQYNEDGTGTYYGWEKFRGSIDEHKGALLLKHEGRFETHGIEVVVSTVEGSGTGELKGFHLNGSVLMQGHGPYDIVFNRS